MRLNSGSSGALVIGNPSLPPSIKEQWHLRDLPSAEQEAKIVGEMMGVKPITGKSASKDAVLRNIPNTEVCIETSLYGFVCLFTARACLSTVLSVCSQPELVNFCILYHITRGNS